MKRFVQHRGRRVATRVDVRRAGPRVVTDPAPRTLPRARSSAFDSATQSVFTARLLEEIANAPPFDGPLIAVLVPVLRRPHRVAPLVQSFRASTVAEDAQIYFIAQSSDVEEVAAIRAVGLEPLLVGDSDQSWARKINRGYERTKEPWMLLGADDLRFHRGWVDAVRPMLRSPGVIGTNDLGNPETANGNRSTHPLVRRLYATICGTVDERRKICHEGYHHNFPDTELVMTARCRSVYAHCSACIVEHLHPLWGKAPQDEVYKLGMSRWSDDQKLFHQRASRFGIGC